jgi:hypothetical protein
MMNTHQPAGAGHDLQFATSVDHSNNQHVPIPSIPTLPPNTNTNTTMDGNVNNNNNPQQQESSYMTQLFESSAHPVICIFHVLFKALAIMTYLFGGLAEHSLNFITVSVCCILLLAIDFWVVKNVTGRLLVGLRWWAHVDLTVAEHNDNANINNSNDNANPNVNESPNNILSFAQDDETKWIFESKENVKINAFDQTWFWTILYATPCVWFFFFILGVLRLHFSWLITVSFGIALNCANVYGYWRCSKDQKAKFDAMLQRGAVAGASSAMKYNVLGKMAHFATRLGGVAANGVNGSNVGGSGGNNGYGNVGNVV